MFHCHICGSHEARQAVVSEVFEIEGNPVLVENIPAEVCIRWKEAVFSRETTYVSGVWCMAKLNP